MTHAELVTVAARWLRNTQRCGVVLTEHNAGREFPDAIGWKRGFSVQVECKVSRSDFFADRRKLGRNGLPTLPAANCWYLTPPHLVGSQDLPEGWGLLEWDGRCVRVAVDVPQVCKDYDGRESGALRAEIYRLYIELRRYQAQGIRYLTIAEQQSAPEARTESEA